MKLLALLGSFLFAVAGGRLAQAQTLHRCPPDSAKVGTTCVDKFEASVWRIPPENPKLARRLQLGRATLADLQAGGAVQVGQIPGPGNVQCTGDDYGPGFPPTGNWTERLYAGSIAGAMPSTCITWFQAEQACRNSEKRLLTNQEWQAAAAGTPDPGDDDDQQTTCATSSAFAHPGGERTACVSLWGTYDQIGNVWEYVSDWVDQARTCTNWDALHGGDLVCMGANVDPASLATPTPAPTPAANQTAAVHPRDAFPLHPSIPGVPIRGGNFTGGTRNGIYAYFAAGYPGVISRSTGFRCGR